MSKLTKTPAERTSIFITLGYCPQPIRLCYRLVAQGTSLWLSIYACVISLLQYFTVVIEMTIMLSISLQGA
jgi:hypothetical protein